MDAMKYLALVETRARELYEMSNQGEWEELKPPYKALWIQAAHRELREDGVDKSG